MTAGRRQACQTWAKFGVPAYCFRFNALTANSNPYYGVQHGSEIPFVFLSLNGAGYTPWSKNPFSGMGKNYIDLAYFVSSNWASFVSDLDPNSWRKSYKGKEAVWLEYSKGQRLLVFDANVTSFTEPDTWRETSIKYINDNSASVYHR
jgi:carboxylesterase type B